MVDLWEYECEGAIFYAFKLFSNDSNPIIITLNDHHIAKPAVTRSNLIKPCRIEKCHIKDLPLGIYSFCMSYSLCILMVSNRHDVIMFVSRLLLMVFTTFDNRDP